MAAGVRALRRRSDDEQVAGGYGSPRCRGAPLTSNGSSIRPTGSEANTCRDCICAFTRGQQRERERESEEGVGRRRTRGASPTCRRVTTRGFPSSLGTLSFGGKALSFHTAFTLSFHTAFGGQAVLVDAVTTEILALNCDHSGASPRPGWATDFQQHCTEPPGVFISSTLTSEQSTAARHVCSS